MSFVSDRIGASKRHIEDTKRLYANLLTSKQLDERQLARPSFEFIQDLVKSIISETRILRDVFNPKDFEIGLSTTSSNQKRRQLSQQDIKKAKMEFVQKLINFAANNKQPVIGCVASKIVAGLEPNKTNELLQSIARICQAKLSTLSSSGRNSSATAERPRTFTKQLESNQSASGRQSRKASSEAGVSSAGSLKGATAKQEQQPLQQQLLQPQQQVNVGNTSDVSAEPKQVYSISPPTFSKQPEQHTDLIQPIKPVTKSVINNEKRKQHIKFNDITSESDISKEIHHVRAHLKLIRSTLTDYIKQEVDLRDALLVSITNLRHQREAY